MTRRSVWWSERVNQHVHLASWGEVGHPVLIFPTAGGDAEEIDRMGLVGALDPLLSAERIKVYSVDSIAGRSWIGEDDPRHSMWLQNQFDATIRHEIVPAIRADCDDAEIEIITAGASIGAFNAVASLCRHPDAFLLAIGMSGTYDLSGWLGGFWSDDFYFSSPIHWLPNATDQAHLAKLRSRMIILAAGQGRWEDPGQAWRMADALGSQSVPNRVDLWSDAHDHDWPTWREMLPLYLDDWC